MKKIGPYLITAAFCAVVALIYMFGVDLFAQTDTVTVYKELHNAFFIPGFVTLLFGGLVFCTNGGAFDMLAFGFLKLLDLFKKDVTDTKYRTFYDYRQAKKSKAKPYVFLLLVGLVFVLVSLVFFALYYQVLPQT